MNTAELLAENSKNRIIENRYTLKIDNCCITAEGIQEYLGAELKEYKALGLNPETRYKVYRPLKELEKAVDSYNLIPLLDIHTIVTPENPKQNKQIGTTGDSAHIKDGKLYNSLAFWTQDAMDDLYNAETNGEGKNELSAGYDYTLVAEKGNFKGMPYDFKFIDIKANHVALVERGRVPENMIADSFLEENETMYKEIVNKIKNVLSMDAKEKDCSMMDKLRDIMDEENYEGGENAKISAIKKLINGLEENQKKESKAEDKEESEIEKQDKEDDDKKSKDSQEKAEEKANDRKAKDNNECISKDPKDKKITDEKEKVMDAALDEVKKYNEFSGIVRNLCKVVIGDLATNVMMDSEPEQLMDKTLKAKGLNINGKDIMQKIAMLEVLRSQVRQKGTNNFIAQDNLKINPISNLSDARQLIKNI